MPEDFATKFKAAWDVFESTCARFVAPEPTYQAWFSHYLITQFGIDRVAREPKVKITDFNSHWKAKVPRSEVVLDVVVMKVPGVHLPHYANKLDRSGDGSGLHRLGRMAIISELKVTATQGEGQVHQEVAQDVYKLSMLLEELTNAGVPDDALPLAYLCILDNHPRKVYNRDLLTRRLSDLEPHPSVEIIGRTLPPELRAPAVALD